MSSEKSETKSSKAAAVRKSSSYRSGKWYRTPIDFGPGWKGFLRAVHYYTFQAPDEEEEMNREITKKLETLVEMAQFMNQYERDGGKAERRGAAYRRLCNFGNNAEECKFVRPSARRHKL